MQYAGWALFILLLAPALQALEVQAGSSFTIKNISRTGGEIKLPTERNKYHNLRILHKNTLDFVRSCTEPCVQPLGEVVPRVQEIRPAKTRPNMWIASVDFKGAWLITFLVFKKGGEFSVKSPENFTFLDTALQMQTREVLLQAVKSPL